MCKTFLKALFSKSYSGRPFNLYDRFDEVKARYDEFCLPQGKQSLPNLNKWSSWKADQIRVFFLYLIVPLLRGILDMYYFQVICKFNKALLLIFKSSISPEEIMVSEDLLIQVHVAVSDREKWDIAFCTLNMHDMIHLPDQIKLTGPLPFTSGFICEAAMKQIKECKYLFQTH